VYGAIRHINHDRHLKAWQQDTRLNLRLLISQAFGVVLLRLS
jgi:hypothetical protein